MDEGEEILQELLENAPEPDKGTTFRYYPSNTPAQGDDDKDKNNTGSETHSQWALGGNGRYIPVGSTRAVLPAGVYETFSVGSTYGVERLTVASDGIYTLPDMATELVLNEVSTFWASEERYRAHNLLYKRGLLLWGPPGGGKTVTLKLLMNELIRRDGLVLVVSSVPLAVMCLKAIRRVEPKRNLIVVLEDIDEIVNYQGESGVLSMLDGENNIDSVLHLATTNHPEKLGPRIINRPSRFDRRVYVGMPNEDARRVYLTKATNGGLDKKQLTKWVRETKEMSIAHLRELVAAVYCLDQPYAEVIGRLKLMAVAPKGEDGFKKVTPGFSGGFVKDANRAISA